MGAAIVGAVVALEKVALEFEHPDFSPKTNQDRLSKMYRAFLYNTILLTKLSGLNTFGALRVNQELMKVSAVKGFKHSP